MKPVFASEQRFRPGMHVFVNQAFEAFNIPKHTHDAIEISYVTGGSGYQYIDDTILRVQRGDIYLLPVGTSHVYRPTSPDRTGSMRIINCVFRPQALAGYPDVPPADSELYRALFASDKLTRPWFHHYDHDNGFTELFHTLLTEYRQQHPLYEAVVHSLFIQLIAKLHRSTLPAQAEMAGSSKIRKAVAYIREHCQENVTLSQAAKHASMSEAHLQRLFKQATGLPFTTYVQQLRMQKCCELLRSTSQTVQQIAEQIGYKDMKHFHRLFRQHTGMTPQEYRKYEEGPGVGGIVGADGEAPKRV